MLVLAVLDKRGALVTPDFEHVLADPLGHALSVPSGQTSSTGGVTHSAWPQGMGSTRQLARR